MADSPPGGGGEEEEMILENGAHGLEGEEERRRRKGHMKTSSITERDRKIGHRRVNEVIYFQSTEIGTIDKIYTAQCT